MLWFKQCWTAGNRGFSRQVFISCLLPTAGNNQLHSRFNFSGMQAVHWLILSNNFEVHIQLLPCLCWAVHNMPGWRILHQSANIMHAMRFWNTFSGGCIWGWKLSCRHLSIGGCRAYTKPCSKPYTPANTKSHTRFVFLHLANIFCCCRLVASIKDFQRCVYTF